MVLVMMSSRMHMMAAGSLYGIVPGVHLTITARGYQVSTSKQLNEPFSL